MKRLQAPKGNSSGTSSKRAINRTRMTYSI
jgi:hypothetical protein